MQRSDAFPWGPAFLPQGRQGLFKLRTQPFRCIGPHGADAGELAYYGPGLCAGCGRGVLFQKLGRVRVNAAVTHKHKQKRCLDSGCGFLPLNPPIHKEMLEILVIDFIHIHTFFPSSGNTF